MSITTEQRMQERDREFMRIWQEQGGSPTRVARVLKIELRNVLTRRRAVEARTGMVLSCPKKHDTTPIAGQIRDINAEHVARIAELEAALRVSRRETLDEEYVKSKIFKIATLAPTPPDWVLKPSKGHGRLGVPSLLWSDWHWGEVVDPSQIANVNSYNLEIAHQRARRLVQTTIDLLTTWMVKPQYPGIVVNLGGDMVSGDIHEELTATNEAEIMPVLLDLQGVLEECIGLLADRFGRVYLPCVAGNHGRNTFKIRAKGRNFTSFDWLLYCFLAKRFEKDKRVAWLIPNGPDAHYAVYGHRYLLTHGDQFRGGDGMIGHIGPVKRGQRKKQSRNAEIDLQFDTMLHGHFHTYSPGRRIIGNGSLVGYSEYSNAGNFEFEPPIQALWLTHPDHGITYHMPIYLSDPKPQPAADWVSWPK